MSTPLYEKHRPHKLSEVVGQPKAVKQIESVGDPGGKSYWISGASGTGKTTLAKIIASLIADEWFVTELDATALTPAKLRDIEQSMAMFGGGIGGRAYLVNEAHGLRRDTIRQLLVLLERLPQHVCIVFTTTKDGQESLFEDEADAHPLLSRCIVLTLTNQGLAKPFAVRVRQIAQLEGLDGQPEAAYIKLAQKHHNNMRSMLQAVAAGAMKE